jgi:hypothetical protein
MYITKWNESVGEVRQDLISCNKSYARILKAHSHSMSGGSIRVSLECQCCFWIAAGLRPYTKSSLTLNEWRFNLSFSWMSMLFLNSCRVSSHIVRYDTNPPAIQKQHWHWREAQIEPPLIECECEWAFIIRALVSYLTMLLLTLPLFKNSIDTQEKLRLNLRSLSVSELLEYRR